MSGPAAGPGRRLLDTARHRHGPGDGTGLRRRAEQKLIDVEQRIVDLELIARMLREAIEAGCEDLIECASIPGCPLPFAELADSGRAFDRPVAG